MALAILAVSLILSVFAALPDTTSTDNSVRQTASDDTIRLVAPPFVSVVSAAEPMIAGDAFPESEAGFCSWIMVGEPIDLEKAVLPFYEIVDLGQNHTIGTIPISNYKITVNVYDVSGRLIKNLHCGSIEGNMKFTWLGDDNYGRQTPQGVYFVRIEYPGLEQTCCEKIIRMK